jgi:hypothetical protein
MKKQNKKPNLNEKARMTKSNEESKTDPKASAYAQK